MKVRWHVAIVNKIVIWNRINLADIGVLWNEDLNLYHSVSKLRQLQEKCDEQRKPLFIPFVDLTKVFDTVG